MSKVKRKRTLIMVDHGWSWLMVPSTFIRQTATAVAKANKLLGIVRRSFARLSKTTLPLLFKKLIRPHLEYGNCVWGHHQGGIKSNWRRSRGGLPSWYLSCEKNRTPSVWGNWVFPLWHTAANEEIWSPYIRSSTDPWCSARSSPAIKKQDYSGPSSQTPQTKGQNSSKTELSECQGGE